MFKLQFHLCIDYFLETGMNLIIAEYIYIYIWMLDAWYYITVVKIKIKWQFFLLQIFMAKSQ